MRITKLTTSPLNVLLTIVKYLWFRVKEATNAVTNQVSAHFIIQALAHVTENHGWSLNRL